MVRFAPLALVAVALAACAAEETSTPGLDGVDDVRASAEPSIGAVTSEPQPVVTEQAETTSPSTSGPSTSASEPPIDSSADVVAGVCTSLRSDGYETRKDTLAALSASMNIAVEESCPEALAALTAAVEIEDRMATFNASGDGLAAANLVCDEGDFSLDITNNVDHAIGVHGSLRLQAEGDSDPIGSTLQPLVIWSLGPGATQTLTGEYELTRDTDAALTCEVDLTAFDATVTDADASLGGEPRQPELSGDDPALWLPALVAQSAAIVGSNLPDAAAAVEDVRSSSYAEVVSRTTAEVDGAPPSFTISVCSASVDRPDDRTVSLIYFAEPTDPSLDLESVLQHGLFRRGNDGQWRWLTDSKYFDSRDFWNCGTPSADR